MKLPNHPYRLIITLSAAAALITALWIDPLEAQELYFLFLVAGFSFLISLFPVYIGSAEYTLVPIVAISSGILIGITPAAAGLALGTTFGSLLRSIVNISRPVLGLRINLLRAGFEAGLQVLPLTVMLVTWSSPAGAFISSDQASLYRYAGMAGTFVAVHFLLYILNRPFHSQISAGANWRRWLALAIIELLPIPLILLSILAYPSLQTNILIALFTITVLMSWPLNRIGIARLTLERRLQELATLNSISRALSATIRLEDLLETLQTQVTEHLGVDNFYIALYDADEDELWYPIAVKFGQRANWSRRSRAERLTDRVIIEGQPVLIGRQAQKELVRIGMPRGEDALFAWMGVPLTSGQETIGCLGVFSISKKVIFTPADLQLLTTIAGQLSVAIENSLLYEQSQQRSSQMETLNELSSLLTASLNLQEMLGQICRSVAQVTSARQAAIYLSDETGQLKLEHAQGFSTDQLESAGRALTNRWNRINWSEISEPVLVKDAYTVTLTPEELQTLQKADIQAWGDLPLTTPAGPIGFLSVYFDAPYTPPVEQTDLLQTFASQAAMAVQNARLYAKTDEALEIRVQQLNILEAVGRQVMANFESEQLFSVILDYAIEFTQSPWGFLALFDPAEDQLNIKAQRGYTFSRRVWPVGETITGKAVRTRQTLNISDISQEPMFNDVTQGQSRSQLSVPLIYEDQVKGVLTLESPELNAFSTDRQRLVEQLANYASLAINNAQLYNEVQRRLRDLSTLYVVTSHLVSSIELEDLFQVTEEAVQSAVQPTAVGIYRWNAVSSSYRLVHGSADRGRFPETLPGDIIERLVPISLNMEILKAPSSDFELTHRLKLDEDTRAFVIPLETKKQNMGTVLLHLPRSRSLEANQIQLLQSVIAQATIALENAFLFADVLEARDRLSTILNSVQEGILVVDMHGNVVLANQPVHEFAGLEEIELGGSALSGLPPAVLNVIGFSEIQAVDMQRMLEHGLVLEGEKITLFAGNTKPERVLERTIIPVISRGDRTIGAMIVLRDMTEEHQIQQTRETITETLIHDLRSPLTAVRAALEILSDEAEEIGLEDELALQALALGQSNSQRVLRLIDSLMEIARMQSGEIELVKQPLNLHELADQVIRNYTILANEYGVFLSNDIPSHLPDANADVEKVERVLSNLVDNALKYTPAGGKVSISAREGQEDELLIRVADNGPGVPAEYQEKIFERFQKVPNQESRRHGTGLGLAFCRIVAEAHGGKIWVEPNQPIGSAFLFTLPALQNTRHPA